jgi:hypothetical protein
LEQRTQGVNDDGTTATRPGRDSPARLRVERQKSPGSNASIERRPAVQITWMC